MNNISTYTCVRYTCSCQVYMSWDQASSIQMASIGSAGLVGPYSEQVESKGINLLMLGLSRAFMFHCDADL